MDKDNVSCVYNEILFSLKKGRKSYHLQQHIDAPERHYAKSNKPVTEGQMLRDSIYMGHIKWSKRNRMLVARE